LNTTQNFEKVNANFNGPKSAAGVSNYHQDYTTTTAGGGMTGKSMEMTTAKEKSGATGASVRAGNRNRPETLHTLSTDEANSQLSRIPKIIGSLGHNFDGFNIAKRRN
jgi:hypothetical protein